jgi:hypothetical protein
MTRPKANMGKNYNQQEHGCGENKDLHLKKCRKKFIKK